MAISEVELRLDAVERYHQHARQAEWQEYWAHMTRSECSLLKYEEVANRLHIHQQIPLGHRMVLLRHIVGSVGRYREFTKNRFLPRATVLQDRWVAVDVTMNSFRGLPPVELYKIGEGYFVIDGNHRISVAFANGNKDIEAIVIECQTTMAFTLDDFKSGRWLLMAAGSDFQSQTHLDQLRPRHILAVSVAAHYQTLLDHIAVHHYLANQDRRSMSWPEAVVSWYETIYLPIVAAIRSHNLQAQFPKRTEADLYVWITQHRERVAEEYELAPLGAKAATAVFAAVHSERIVRRSLLAWQQRVRWPWGFASSKWPPGMAKDEFCALRLRHDAGELSVTEAGRKQKQDPRFAERICEGQLGIQFSV